MYLSRESLFGITRLSRVMLNSDPRDRCVYLCTFNTLMIDFFCTFNTLMIDFFLSYLLVPTLEVTFTLKYAAFASAILNFEVIF